MQTMADLLFHRFDLSDKNLATPIAVVIHPVICKLTVAAVTVGTN